MSELNVFLARQPIFDRRLSVCAYELLARSSAKNAFTGSDPDEASSGLIRDSLLVYQLESVTGGLPAFINVTKQLLAAEHLRALPSDRVVLEVLETVEPDAEVLESCRALRAAGYRIALDDFVPRPELEPLVALSDIIKIDFLETQGEERREVYERYARGGRQLLAEKVETREDLRQALEIGYSLFQGFFFCEPEMLARRDVPRCKLNYLRFLRELSRSELDVDRIEEIIRAEPSLAIKLLRYMNSTAMGIRNEVTSVRHALVYLGEAPLKRWGALVTVGEIGRDKPSELVVTSLLRARFCELLTAPDAADGDDEGSPFLCGLLSTLDAMVGRPMEELLEEIGVGPDIQEALLRGGTPVGQILDIVTAFERGDWVGSVEAAASLGLGQDRISDCYGEALRWVDEIFLGPQQDAA